MFNNKERFKAEFTKRAVEQYGRGVNEIHISVKIMLLFTGRKVKKYVLEKLKNN